MIASSFHGMVSKDLCLREHDSDYDHLRTRTPSPEQVGFRCRYSDEMSYAPFSLPPNFVATPMLYLAPQHFWHTYQYIDEDTQFEKKHDCSHLVNSCSDRYLNPFPTEAQFHAGSAAHWFDSTSRTTDAHREEDEAAVSESTIAAVTSVIGEDDAPSKGSIGHPTSCSPACKYIKKERGCKDGDACTRCHLCVFRRAKPKKSDRRKKLKERQESDASD